jgi:hypothetical protein
MLDEQPGCLTNGVGTLTVGQKTVYLSLPDGRTPPIMKNQ